MTEEEYEECKSLLDAWFEYKENPIQGAFNRARWAVRKLAKDLGLNALNERDLHENNP